MMHVRTRRDALLRGVSGLEVKEDKGGGGDFAELKTAIEGYTAEAKKHADTVADMRRELDEIAKKQNRLVLNGAGGGGEEKTDVAERKALSVFARTGDEAELKALSVGSDPDGGYVVHSVMAQSMIKRIYDLSPMRRLSRVETITIGDAWEEPLDLDESGATWVGEQTARPATDTPGLGMLRVPVHEIYALQKVTQRLIDDAAIDVGGWVTGKVNDKLARAEGAACVSGDGVLKPKGFLAYDTAATADASRARGVLQHFASGGASDFAASNPGDVLKNMVWGLRTPYRQNGAWLMNSNTASRIDKFKDGNGDYLWRDGMTSGAPPSLLGYPVEFDEGMPDVAANALPIAFGDFRQAYLIVDKAGVRWLRDPYSDKPHVLLYAYRRVGGGLANSEALKLLKIAA